MAEIERVGGLEIEQALGFQRRQWQVQRVAWVVMMLLLVAGLAGLLGGGPLSHDSLAAGRLELDYGRLVRKRADERLSVRVAGGAVQDGRVRLWIDQAYLDAIEITQIVPEPEQVEAGADRMVFVFRVSDPTRPAAIGFDTQPFAVGPLRGEVGLVGGPSIEFTQFVYP